MKPEPWAIKRPLGTYCGHAPLCKIKNTYSLLAKPFSVQCQTMFRATSLATRATLFLSVLVSTLAVLGRAEDQRYPQITVSDGNIVITPATSKNITFDHHDSESYVNIGPYNVVHLLSSVNLCWFECVLFLNYYWYFYP